MSKITIKDLLEAGVHFGHQTKRWNPKMKDYVYGEKNGIYIIDLTKTMRQIYEACNFLQRVAADGGNILFVGTKRQAQEIVKEAAEKTGMFHVTERWLGGTLTNNLTIQKSIFRMHETDKIIASAESSPLKKKELASHARTSARLHKNLDGICGMKNLPSALVVVDVCNEEIAVKEAVKLKIPVVAIVDTNGNIDCADYPIVANDDAVRSIKIIIDVLAESIADAALIYRKRAEEEKIARAAQKAAKEAEEKEKKLQKEERGKRSRKPAKKEEQGEKPRRPLRPLQGKKPKPSELPPAETAKEKEDKKIVGGEPKPAKSKKTEKSGLKTEKNSGEEQKNDEKPK